MLDHHPQRFGERDAGAEQRGHLARHLGHLLQARLVGGLGARDALDLDAFGAAAPGLLDVGDEQAQTYVDEFGGDAEFYRNAYRNHYSVTFAPAGGVLSEGITAIFGFVRDAGVISTAPDPSDVFETW